MLLIDMICGTGAVGIEESVFGGDLDSGAYGGDAELDGVLGGKCGTDFDETVVGSEALILNFEAVEAEGKIAGDREAGVVGGEGAMELQGVTGEIDGSFDGLPVGTGDFEAEFSGVALSQERKSEEKKSDVEK